MWNQLLVCNKHIIEIMKSKCICCRSSFFFIAGLFLLDKIIVSAQQGRSQLLKPPVATVESLSDQKQGGRVHCSTVWLRYLFEKGGGGVWSDILLTSLYSFTSLVPKRRFKQKHQT